MSDIRDNLGRAVVGNQKAFISEDRTQYFAYETLPTGSSQLQAEVELKAAAECAAYDAAHAKLIDGILGRPSTRRERIAGAILHDDPRPLRERIANATDRRNGGPQ